MNDESINHGTGNVFADLGLPDAAERQLKTRLAMAINAILKERHLRQREVAGLLGIDQPKVSQVVNYRLDGFSVERLIGFLTQLNQDVDILIRPRSGAGRGEVAVLAAAG